MAKRKRDPRLEGQTYMSRYKTGEERIPERLTCNYCRRLKDVSDMAYPHVCADCYYDER